MIAPRHDEEESVLQIKARAEAGTGTSGRSQSGHDQAKLGHVGRGAGREGEGEEQTAAAKRANVQKGG